MCHFAQFKLLDLILHLCTRIFFNLSSRTVDNEFPAIIWENSDFSLLFQMIFFQKNYGLIVDFVRHIKMPLNFCLTWVMITRLLWCICVLLLVRLTYFFFFCLLWGFYISNMYVCVRIWVCVWGGLVWDFIYPVRHSLSTLTFLFLLLLVLQILKTSRHDCFNFLSHSFSFLWCTGYAGFITLKAWANLFF